MIIIKSLNRIATKILNIKSIFFTSSVFKNTYIVKTPKKSGRLFSLKNQKLFLFPFHYLNKRMILMLLFCFLIFELNAQNSLIQNISNRNNTSLNGKWHYIIDPYETGYYDFRYKAYDTDEKMKSNPGAYYNNAKPKNKLDRIEYSFDASPTLLVPGDWNSQDEKLLYYEGTIWYKKSFDYKKTKLKNRVFIHFGAVNYIAEVYLNGNKLGKHEGGFTPFSYEVTNSLKEKNNYLIVKVDNTRHKDAIPTLNTDWWNYGGITRDVSLVEVPNKYIYDYFIQLKQSERGIISGYIQLSNVDNNEDITIEIPELDFFKKIRTDKNGYVTLDFSLKGITLWTPENPKLYDIVLKTNYEELKDQIGFRTIESKNGEIILNGKPIFLRGICMHEENTMRGGRAYSEADAIISLHWAKELNCNFMRLAHYPHNEHMIRLADKEGMLLWSEIPVYWTIDFDKDFVYENAENQLTDMINRDKNRASIIIWSMANETPISEERNMFLSKLISQARAIDNTRLISAALLHKSENGFNKIADPISKEVDIVAFNQYMGWYGGHPKDITAVKWQFDQNKPVIISEFGAGVLGGYHADKDTRWSEEYGDFLYKQTIKMMENMSNLRGVTPWILADFRSPKRNLPNIQDGWNRKGLISNTGTKKLAFYTLQKWYRNIEMKRKRK